MLTCIEKKEHNCGWSALYRGPASEQDPDYWEDKVLMECLRYEFKTKFEFRIDEDVYIEVHSGNMPPLDPIFWYKKKLEEKGYSHR